MHPVLLDFFGLFKLHTYGLMIAIGFYVGAKLGEREAARVDLRGDNSYEKFISDLCLWILVVAMIGSRVLYIVVNWNREYSSHPEKIFRIWEGGLVFYGGFVSSVVFSYLFSRKHRRNFFQVSDILIPSVALGHFFGRLGCFAAGCCWGRTVSSDFPLGVQFPAGSLAHSSMRSHLQIGHADAWTPHVHPVQLYESSGELALFFVLLLVRSRKRFHGQVLLVYLFLYPLLRTSLEFLRGDTERGVYSVLGMTLSTSQIISILLSAVAVTLLLVLLKRKSGQPLAASPAVAR